MTRVAGWVRELTEEVCGGAPFKIGDRVKRPDGTLVQITGGQYWGTYGISNFWQWRVVNSDGSLGKTESGYGWEPPDPPVRAPRPRRRVVKK